MSDIHPLDQLVAACHWIGAKGWAPATGGNMSVRQDAQICLLSESGKDKGTLTRDDFIQVDIATGQALSGRKPSAETGLHTLISALPRGRRGAAHPYGQCDGIVTGRAGRSAIAARL